MELLVELITVLLFSVAGYVVVVASVVVQLASVVVVPLIRVSPALHVRHTVQLVP